MLVPTLWGHVLVPTEVFSRNQAQHFFVVDVVPLSSPLVTECQQESTAIVVTAPSLQ